MKMKNYIMTEILHYYFKALNMEQAKEANFDVDEATEREVYVTCEDTGEEEQVE